MEIILWWVPLFLRDTILIEFVCKIIVNEHQIQLDEYHELLISFLFTTRPYAIEQLKSELSTQFWNCHM